MAGYLPFVVPSFDDEDGLIPESVEEVEVATDGTENVHLNNRTLGFYKTPLNYF